MVVSGVSRFGAGALPARRATGSGGFGLRAERQAGSSANVPISGVAVASLLAMQEDRSDERQDSEARQHGEAVIEELTALQRASLGALLGQTAPDLASLSRLVERPVAAADPGLAAVLRAIRVRAEVELARHARPA